MRIDLRFQEIQFRREFFVLDVFLPRLKLKPVDGKMDHREEDDDEEIGGDDLDDKARGVQIPGLACEAVDEVSLKGETACNDDGEGQNKLKKIPQAIFVFQKTRKKIEIIQITDEEGE